MRFLLSVALLAAMFFSAPAQAYTAQACPADAACGHGIAMFGDLKYGPGFRHFDYANPDAPKGGSVHYGDTGTFDSLNGYILKGVPAPGIGLLYETLLTASSDETFSEYGLLAESVELAKDKSWIVFRLRENARWHDGKPITAGDVAFSFRTLMKDGLPFYRIYYADVAGVEKLGDRTVKFTFKTTGNRELPLIVGQLPVLPEHYYATHDFTKTTLEPPPGSGPYKVEALEPGKWIRYARVDDYWGKDLPVNRGRYNFGRITYNLYRDASVAVEAFKAGEYDLRQENISKVWANAYNIPALEKGDLVKEAIPHKVPTGMQGFVFNVRRDKFADRRVREAIGLAYDFEWANKTLFYGAYARTESFFSNSVFASSGLPRGKELALLEKFHGQIPDEVFTEEYHAPRTDGSGNARPNLIRARDLLQEAGWEVEDGVLRDPDGRTLEIEFLLNSPTFERVVAPMLRNLKKLGIEAKMRVVDSAQYIKRTEDFDFDIVVHTFGQSNAPGNEQRDYWHSSQAGVPGSRNLIGVKNQAADALVEKIITAQSKEDLLDATRALDRVLLHNHYVIPNWHTRTFRTLYWNKFGRPEKLPDYSLGLDFWWLDKEKEAKLNAAYGRRRALSTIDR